MSKATSQVVTKDTMPSEDPRQSCQPVRMMSRTTAIAIARESHSNALSPMREGGAIARATDRGSSGATAGRMAISMRALHLDLADTC